MATITLQEAKCVKTTSGVAPELIWQREAASQSFKRGQALSSAAGQVTVVATGATAIDCFAAADATGVTNAQIACYNATDDNIFEMNAYHATPASAVTNKNMQKVSYGITVANNKTYLNIADTSTVAVNVVELSPKDVEGDTYGRVLVKVKKSAQTG